MFGIEQRQSADGGHRLSAVQQSDAFFRFERNWSYSGGGQRFAAGHSTALIERFALADHNQREMSQRRQVTRRPDRSARRNHRMDASVEHSEESLDHFETAA